MEKKAMIEVRDVQKSFRIPHEKTTSLKQAAIGLFREKNYTTFHVLKDISFTVNEGEFFGIIGRNGCGKSTLLKILAGIYTHDSGELNINGKISPFLELGVGFNPELSGRDNVFLNGAILGLSKKEIAAKYDEIVEFAELSEFMDQKLKNYSSGMQVRLAFSVAIHAKAPILLLDEVLAVGDAAFQRKCQNVFRSLKEENRTIVFVTHDMAAVREYCDRAILISSGKIICEGSPEKVAEEYLAKNGQAEATEIKNLNNDWAIKRATLNGKDEEIKIPYGENLNLKFGVSNKGKAKKANIHLAILDQDNEEIFFASSAEKKEYNLGKETKVEIDIKKELVPGNYVVALSLHDPKSGESYYGNTAIIQFKITSSKNGPETTSSVDWK